MFVIAAAGCLRSQSKRCGDVVCPEGRACAQGRCVDQSLATACTRLSEGASCTMSEFGTGVCQQGFCIIGKCGDGLINAVDACDGDNLNGKTCLDFGSSDAAGLKCTSDCAFDLSACTARCGDSIKHSAEECDGKDFGGKTCITEGYYAGSLVCTMDCTVNFGGCKGKCGDGERNSFMEQCDGIDFGGSTCEERGFFGAVSPLSCTSGCALDASSCSCGDQKCLRDTQQCVIRDDIARCEAKT